MIDRYGRPLEDLRVTLTHVCNFSCFFCHMEGEGTESMQGLSPYQIGLVSRVAVEFGVKSVKLTGGEPTLRRDLPEIISEIKSSGVSDVSMTTNGFLLANIAGKLKDAGLDRINVSLHALTREKFKDVTGVDGLDRVVAGIREAKNQGFKPIKLNFVLTKRNSEEAKRVIEFSEENGIDELHLIELHPVGLGKSTFSYHRSMEDLEREIAKMAVKSEIREKHFRPRYTLPSGLVIEIVKPYANPIFCAGCNRVRLTVDGKLKTCLYREDKVIDVMYALSSEDLTYEERLELLRHGFEATISIREPNFKYMTKIEAQQA
ncbi:7,8-dihydro-6-hydroxymethylpterin dimethyltransferase [Metallosphaera sp. J1]|uniref:GTP 3',8-cyclase MoaA n=1 Tax=Metallosphaera TaxID=41980 RepID=UPI001EDCBF13|nr:GTP 3',8-cyclase MoaA [Metallosphaera javensis (ex Hofmann et al. 2022)]MCG3109552.1 7,8-dihydro-6-hydroxymethylpterin dimethyltransferase [Metallosphaera javensis (ex Hofmann et al. 2022)]BCS94112.1 MAG: GTP 3',8-cyclase MoaA [Metallosphaera javensis (ex Sakai et al. 2022)]